MPSSDKECEQISSNSIQQLRIVGDRNQEMTDEEQMNRQTDWPQYNPLPLKTKKVQEIN